MWKPDLHYLVYNNPPLYEINSAHTLTCYFFKAYFNIIFPPTCRYYKLSLLNQILRHVLSFPCLLHVPAQFNNRTKCCADPRGRAVYGVPVLPPDCWDRRVRIPLAAWMFVPCDFCVLYRPLRRADPLARGVLLCVYVCHYV